MSQVKTLKIVRSGEFPLRTYGNHHCGTSHSFNVKYHLITLCDPRLDHRGFLFDQLNIDKFFHVIKSTSLSCEQLTERTLVKLKKFILRENPDCLIHAMSLTLSPEPYLAAMTSSWAVSPEYTIAG
jgi:hypothetical protein